MIGGYAQLAYSFNYYGTVGSNRDEFIMIRKMKNINWLDGEGRDQVQEAKNENTLTGWNGTESR
jgi:nitrate reductase alpha subunit